MKSSLSLVPLVFLISSNSYPTSSTVRSPTRASTLWVCRLWCCPSCHPLQWDLWRRVRFFLTLPLFSMELKLLELSWLLLSSVSPPFPPKNLHLLWQPTRCAYTSIQRRVCSHQGQQLARKFWAISHSYLALLLHLVVTLKLKLPFDNGIWTSLPRTRLLESLIASPSLTTRSSIQEGDWLHGWGSWEI